MSYTDAAGGRQKEELAQALLKSEIGPKYFRINSECAFACEGKQKMKRAAAIFLTLTALVWPSEFNAKDWRITALPHYPSAEWSRANQSRDEYEVRLVKNMLHVGHAKRRTGDKKEVEGGALIAVNHGEFGGGLYWKKDGVNSTRFISPGNFHTFFEVNNRHYVFEGLAHLSVSNGNICRLALDSGEWRVAEIIKLGDAPYAYAFLDSSTITVVASNKLLDVNLNNRKIKSIVDSAFWSGMYPNSIVNEFSSTQWIGMRGGVLKITRGKKIDLIWFTKK